MAGKFAQADLELKETYLNKEGLKVNIFEVRGRDTFEFRPIGPTWMTTTQHPQDPDNLQDWWLIDNVYYNYDNTNSTNTPTTTKTTTTTTPTSNGSTTARS